MKISKETIHKLVMMVEGPTVNPNIILNNTSSQSDVLKGSKNKDKE